MIGTTNTALRAHGNQSAGLDQNAEIARTYRWQSHTRIDIDGGADGQIGVTEQIVQQEARRAGIPVEALMVTWEVECNLRATCPPGDGGESYGPFQVQEVAATRHGCASAFRVGRHKVACAARILLHWHARTNSWSLAFTRYQWPAYPYKGPSPYGAKVYAVYLRRLMRGDGR